MTKEEELQEIYDLIPEVPCKGLCTDQCSVIGMTQLEAMRLPNVPVVRTRIGLTVKPIAAGRRLSCPFLEKGKCSQYDNRPAICRLYGAVDIPAMLCPHGCRPARLLTNVEGATILHMITALDKRKEEE